MAPLYVTGKFSHKVIVFYDNCMRTLYLYNRESLSASGALPKKCSETIRAPPTGNFSKLQP